MKASINETMKLHNAYTISLFIVNETHFHWIREPKVNQNGLSMYGYLNPKPIFMYLPTTQLPPSAISTYTVLALTFRASLNPKPYNRMMLTSLHGWIHSYLGNASEKQEGLQDASYSVVVHPQQTSITGFQWQVRAGSHSSDVIYGVQPTQLFNFSYYRMDPFHPGM